MCEALWLLSNWCVHHLHRAHCIEHRNVCYKNKIRSIIACRCCVTLVAAVPSYYSVYEHTHTHFLYFVLRTRKILSHFRKIERMFDLILVLFLFNAVLVILRYCHGFRRRHRRCHRLHACLHVKKLLSKFMKFSLQMHVSIYRSHITLTFHSISTFRYSFVFFDFHFAFVGFVRVTILSLSRSSKNER